MQKVPAQLQISCAGLYWHCISYVSPEHVYLAIGRMPDNYLLNFGAETSPPAKAFGPGFDIEKYIFAAFVVPKS